MRAKVLFLGKVSGFTLTQVRAFEYDMIYEMLAGTDFTIPGTTTCRADESSARHEEFISDPTD